MKMKKILILSVFALFTAACGRTQSAPATSREAQSEDKELLCGGYTNQRPLGPEEKVLFETLTAGLSGVAYTPESVATQVVAGTNYRFICSAKTAIPEPQTYRAEITVFKPLPNRGEPCVTGIKRIEE